MKAGFLGKAVVVAGLLTGLQLGVAVAAEDGVVNFAGQDPSEDEIIEALSPAGPSLKTRGIGRPGAAAAAGAAIAPSMKPAKASFDQITFEFNSDRINAKAKPMLDRLGSALSSPQLSGVEYVIEGHTDISGTLQYNMNLSQRRAESVKRYLVENFGIESSRLKTDGKGPTDLLDKANPRSGMNRRVVFVANEASE